MLTSDEPLYPKNEICKRCMQRPCRELFKGTTYPGKMVFVHHSRFVSLPCNQLNVQGNEEDTEESAALTDDVVVTEGPVEITNPRWEPIEEAEEGGDPEIPLLGDNVRLLADVKNYPEGAAVSFDIYDVTESTPLRITTVKGTNNGGKASAEWTVEDPQKRGEQLKLQFEAGARSKYTKKTELPWQDKIRCDFVEMPDVLFHHNSAIPCLDEEGTLLGALTATAIFAKENSGKEIVIFGHTDTSGDPAYNSDLSGWRAEGIKALLDGDKDAWLDVVDLASKVEDYQAILKTLSTAHGWGCDPGTVDNIAGQKTKAAIKRFQEEFNSNYGGSLATDGIIGPKTWEAIFATVHSLFKETVTAETGDDTLPSLSYGYEGSGLYSCGESFPVDSAEKDGYKSATNRRVEIVFYDKGKAPELKKPADKKKVEKKEAPVYDRKKVEKKPVVVKPAAPLGGDNIVLDIVFPQINDAAKPHKQYVNLAANGKNEGIELTIKVKAKDLKADTAGKKVYWKITADAGNSKRNSPKTGVMEKAGAALVEFTAGVATINTPFNGNESSIVLACGLAGGDKYTVEIGTDGKNFPKKFLVENWRKLEYEIWQPLATGADKLTDYTVFQADKKPGLSIGVKNYMKSTLDNCFVEFTERHSDNYKASDLPSNGQYNIFDSKYFNKAAGKKTVFLTLNQATNVLAAKAKFRKDAKVVTKIFADYIGEYERWNQSLTGIFSETQAVINRYIVEKTIDNEINLGIVQGIFSIKKLAWKATDWFDFSAPGGGAWKPILLPADPGYANRNITTFNTEADIKAHLEFSNCHTLQIKLPATAGKPNYPANKLTKDATGQLTSGGKPVRIQFSIDGYYLNANFNGAALQGDIWMTTFGGEVVDNGLGNVLLHELGHNMGQVYANKATDATFGRPAAKAIPGIPFPPDVRNGGNSYGGHDHTGTHCAAGIVNKAALSFQTQDAFKQCKCVMFGASDLKSNKHFNFCDNCLTFIKAEDLSSIRKSWT